MGLASEQEFEVPWGVSAMMPSSSFTTGCFTDDDDDDAARERRAISLFGRQVSLPERDFFNRTVSEVGIQEPIRARL